MADFGAFLSLVTLNNGFPVYLSVKDSASAEIYNVQLKSVAGHAKGAAQRQLDLL